MQASAAGVLAGWVEHPAPGLVWDDGGVVVVTDLADLDDPILHLPPADGEEYAATCIWDHWAQHLTYQGQENPLEAAIREAELEGWHDRAEQLRQLRSRVTAQGGRSAQPC